MKLKRVKVRGYETYNSKEVKEEHKGESKANVQMKEEEQEAPGPLVSHGNNLLF